VREQLVSERRDFLRRVIEPSSERVGQDLVEGHEPVVLVVEPKLGLLVRNRRELRVRGG
jgi:hypothetical protein